jgi:2-polyprenyl-3-methyl-5-hydroxy-6-metoxy-1,4-benzoquinol methylase
MRAKTRIANQRLDQAFCPKCRQASPHHFNIGDRGRKTTEESFDYYKCLNCGIVFLWPIPPNVGKYYSTDYYNIPSSLKELAAVAEIERHKIETVMRFKSEGKLLEIGPAYGSFSYLAKKEGFDVSAIEMDETCCRFISDVVGIRAIHCTDIAAALREIGPFDVITLWQVLEHLPDPWAVLSTIVERLNHKGILLVATPNPESLQFHLLRQYWAHVDAPRHLELIPSSALVGHLRKLGATPLFITTSNEESVRCNYFGWEASFYAFTDKRYIRRLLYLAGKILSRILKPVERLGRLGSAYTAVFRKDHL